MFNADDSKESKFFDIKHIGGNTLLLIGAVLVAIGIGGSFFFSQTIEKFFWEARTKSVVEVVYEQGKHVLQKNDIASWQNNEASGRLGTFSKEMREYIPNTVATKIYTTNGILAWSNLKSAQAGYQKPESDGELKIVAKAGHMITDADDSVKQELNKNDLLEVWTTLKTEDGATAGFVELYFDSSDIKGFVQKIQYSIWVAVAIVLGIVILLLRLAFRKQDELIIRQAHELSNVIEKSPIGIFMIDSTGNITTVNQKMLDMFKETGGNDVLGKNIFDLPCTQKLETGSVTRATLLGAPFDKETSCTNVDGGEIHRHYQGTPLFAEDGKTVERVLFMVEDITEQKKLEQGLATQAKGLESTVGDRTKALEEKIEELEKFQRLTVDREIRMTELKQEIEKMRIKLESLGAKANTI